MNLDAKLRHISADSNTDKQGKQLLPDKGNGLSLLSGYEHTPHMNKVIAGVAINQAG